MRKILKPKYFPLCSSKFPTITELLYMEGELPPDDAIYLAVVGARRFTTYGKEACERIIGGLNNKTRQFVIVSGLAIGIDGIAAQSGVKKRTRRQSPFSAPAWTTKLCTLVPI